MEVQESVDNNDTNKMEAHLISVAAFVEGGVQEACDDACSICLDDFCESEPSTVTGCKHEFHLQCILEWCQRSSQCPMCWQAISLKDPDSQELLEAVEHERNLRSNPPRNAVMFHHPMLGDFELQHLPVGVSDSELEERIIQHLAAAAAMGRARHFARREGQRSRSSAQSRPQFLAFSTHPNAPAGSASSSPSQRGGSQPFHVNTSGNTSSPRATTEEDLFQGTASALLAQAYPVSASASGSSALPTNQHESSVNDSRPSPSKDQAGPSDQSFSESFKSRFNAASTRCKETISKGTRGWKERLFSRNTSMAEIRSEVRREVDAGIGTVSRMIEHLETRDNGRTNDASVSNDSEDNAIQGSETSRQSETGGSNPLVETI